jgi:hypothetical protein
MLKASNPKVVFDPYINYLPQHGEEDISINFTENNLCLNIHYEDELENETKKLEINFENVIFFKVESVPGVKSINVIYEEAEMLTNLIEFIDSEFKNDWEKHFNGFIKLSHYKIFFQNINKSVEIIAESVQHP